MNKILKVSLGIIFWPFLLLFGFMYAYLHLILYITPLGWFVLYMDNNDEVLY